MTITQTNLIKDLRKELEKRSMVVTDLRNNTMSAISINTVIDIVLERDEKLTSLITTIKLLEQ